ncbi:hypothetical protein TNCV_3944031 [Trichonephila clavipes]|nr:hypothetical protein TNCV_3944031 [Trichonephila clavipes]
MFENTGRFMDRSDRDGYLCLQFHFRIDRRVVYKVFHGTPEKKNQGIWEAKRRDHHAQSTCFELSGPVETTCGNE